MSTQDSSQLTEIELEFTFDETESFGPVNITKRVSRLYHIYDRIIFRRNWGEMSRKLNIRFVIDVAKKMKKLDNCYSILFFQQRKKFFFRWKRHMILLQYAYKTLLNYRISNLHEAYNENRLKAPLKMKKKWKKWSQKLIHFDNMNHYALILYQRNIMNHYYRKWKILFHFYSLKTKKLKNQWIKMKNNIMIRNIIFESRKFKWKLLSFHLIMNEIRNNYYINLYRNRWILLYRNITSFEKRKIILSFHTKYTYEMKWKVLYHQILTLHFEKAQRRSQLPSLFSAYIKYKKNEALLENANNLSVIKSNAEIAYVQKKYLEKWISLYFVYKTTYTTLEQMKNNSMSCYMSKIVNESTRKIQKAFRHKRLRNNFKAFLSAVKIYEYWKFITFSYRKLYPRIKLPTFVMNISFLINFDFPFINFSLKFDYIKDRYDYKVANNKIKNINRINYISEKAAQKIKLDLTIIPSLSFYIINPFKKSDVFQREINFEPSFDLDLPLTFLSKSAIPLQLGKKMPLKKRKTKKKHKNLSKKFRFKLLFKNQNASAIYRFFIPKFSRNDIQGTKLHNIKLIENFVNINQDKLFNFYPTNDINAQRSNSILQGFTISQAYSFSFFNFTFSSIFKYYNKKPNISDFLLRKLSGLQNLFVMKFEFNFNYVSLKTIERMKRIEFPIANLPLKEIVINISIPRTIFGKNYHSFSLSNDKDYYINMRKSAQIKDISLRLIMLLDIHINNAISYKDINNISSLLDFRPYFKQERDLSKITPQFDLFSPLLCLSSSKPIYFQKVKDESPMLSDINFNMILEFDSLFDFMDYSLTRYSKVDLKLTKNSFAQIPEISLNIDCNISQQLEIYSYQPNMYLNNFVLSSHDSKEIKVSDKIECFDCVSALKMPIKFVNIAHAFFSIYIFHRISHPHTSFPQNFEYRNKLIFDSQYIQNNPRLNIASLKDFSMYSSEIELNRKQSLITQYSYDIHKFQVISNPGLMLDFLFINYLQKMNLFSRFSIIEGQKGEYDNELLKLNQIILGSYLESYYNTIIRKNYLNFTKYCIYPLLYSLFNYSKYYIKNEGYTALFINDDKSISKDSLPNTLTVDKHISKENLNEFIQSLLLFNYQNILEHFLNNGETLKRIVYFENIKLPLLILDSQYQISNIFDNSLKKCLKSSISFASDIQYFSYGIELAIQKTKNCLYDIFDDILDLNLNQCLNSSVIYNAIFIAPSFQFMKNIFSNFFYDDLVQFQNKSISKLYLYQFNHIKTDKQRCHLFDMRHSEINTNHKYQKASLDMFFQNNFSFPSINEASVHLSEIAVNWLERLNLIIFHRTYLTEGQIIKKKAIHLSVEEISNLIVGPFLATLFSNIDKLSTNFDLIQYQTVQYSIPEGVLLYLDNCIKSTLCSTSLFTHNITFIPTYGSLLSQNNDNESSKYLETLDNIDISEIFDSLDCHLMQLIMQTINNSSILMLDIFLFEDNLLNQSVDLLIQYFSNDLSFSFSNNLLQIFNSTLINIQNSTCFYNKTDETYSDELLEFSFSDILNYKDAILFIQNQTNPKIAALKDKKPKFHNEFAIHQLHTLDIFSFDPLILNQFYPFTSLMNYFPLLSTIKFKSYFEISDFSVICFNSSLFIDFCYGKVNNLNSYKSLSKSEYLQLPFTFDHNYLLLSTKELLFDVFKPSSIILSKLSLFVPHIKLRQLGLEKSNDTHDAVALANEEISDMMINILIKTVHTGINNSYKALDFPQHKEKSLIHYAMPNNLLSDYSIAIQSTLYAINIFSFNFSFINEIEFVTNNIIVEKSIFHIEKFLSNMFDNSLNQLLHKNNYSLTNIDLLQNNYFSNTVEYQLIDEFTILVNENVRSILYNSKLNPADISLIPYYAIPDRNSIVWHLNEPANEFISKVAEKGTQISNYLDDQFEDYIFESLNYAIYGVFNAEPFISFYDDYIFYAGIDRIIEVIDYHFDEELDGILDDALLGTTQDMYNSFFYNIEYIDITKFDIKFDLDFFHTLDILFYQSFSIDLWKNLNICCNLIHNFQRRLIRYQLPKSSKQKMPRIMSKLSKPLDKNNHINPKEENKFQRIAINMFINEFEISLESKLLCSLIDITQNSSQSIDSFLINSKEAS